MSACYTPSSQNLIAHCPRIELKAAEVVNVTVERSTVGCRLEGRIGVLELYFGAGSSAFAALVALEAAGADYVPHRLDLAAGDQRTPEYLGINPLGRVPALVVDGNPITELSGVLSYIGARYPEAALVSVRNPIETAKTYEWLSWFSSTFHMYVAQVLRGERFSDDPSAREALKASGRQNFAAELIRLDKAAEGATDGLIGDNFSIVDAFNLVVWRWSEKLGIETAPFPHWSRCVQTAFARPFVQRAIACEAATERWKPRALCERAS